MPMNLSIGTKWGGSCSGEVVGACRVVIGGCVWKCLKVVHAGQHRKTKDGTPATYAEWYVAENGRTVLFRRFNGPGYAAADQLRSFESLKGELEVQFEGVTFRHSYDCIPDIALVKHQTARSLS